MDRKLIPIPAIGMTNKAKSLQNKDSKKYPQGYFKNKPCVLCDEMFEPYAPSEHYCSEECRKEGITDAYLHRKYAISLEDYRDLYESQSGKCYICEGNTQPKTRIKSTMDLTIDHDHKTGKVRGLLCNICNLGLGKFKDDQATLQKAIDYLNKPELIFTKTDKARLKKIRNTDTNITLEIAVSVLIDSFDNNLDRTSIAKKYNITSNRVKSITNNHTVMSRKALERYQQIKNEGRKIQ